MSNENESLAGKVFNVGKVCVPDFPNISYRYPLAPIKKIRTANRYCNYEKVFKQRF